MRRYLVALLLIQSGSAAAQTCDAAIAQFRRVLDADVQSGHVNKSVYSRIVPELTRIGETCRSDQNAQVASALTSLKRRHGYR